jgi:hypothetical protein
MSRPASALVGLLCLLPMLAHGQETAVASVANQDGVRIDIISLKRTEGDTVTLRLNLRNEGNRDVSLTLGNARLIDLANRRRYDAGLTSSQCRAESGKQASCWAVFGAPPKSVKTMTVQFYESFDLVSGVPLSE